MAPTKSNPSHFLISISNTQNSPILTKDLNFQPLITNTENICKNQNVPGSWSEEAKALHWKTEGLMEVNSMWTKEIREIINRCLSDFKPVTTSTKKGNALDHRSGLS